jgi:hypothetical protein
MCIVSYRHAPRNAQRLRKYQSKRIKEIKEECKEQKFKTPANASNAESPQMRRERKEVEKCKYPDNIHAKTPSICNFVNLVFGIGKIYSKEPCRLPLEVASRSRICLSFMSSCSRRDCRLGPSPKSKDSMERRV